MKKEKQRRPQFWRNLICTMVFTSASTFGIVVNMSMIDNTTVNADMFASSHYCRKPIKPYSFESEWEIRAFQDEVDAYKRCIDDFVEEQNDAIRSHQEAAEEAVDEWNNFVRWELQ